MRKMTKCRDRTTLLPVLESSSYTLTSRFAKTLACCHSRRGSDDQVEKSNEQKKLVHRTTLQQGIVSINGLGDCLKGVHFTRDANKVSGDETNNGKHGSASMADFRFTEPRHERLIGLRKLQLYKYR